MSGSEVAVRRDPYDWTQNLAPVGDLAQRICGTEFVPGSLRGKPAAVAACILFGAEIGIGPMKSLTSIHVVDGRPAMSAELMRALVLAAGHSIQVAELTATRCVLVGVRRGQSDGTTIQYTTDDAKRAGVLGKKVWQQYPREMLLARATTVLCRAVFPDVIGGMASVEEMEDAGPAAAVEVEAGPPARPARRTVKRAAAKPAPAPVDEPPLDDEVDTETGEIVEAEIVDEPEVQDVPAVTAKQLTAIAAGMSACGWTDRADRLRLASAVARRDLSTSKELTRAEAAELLDALAWAQSTDDPQAALAGLLEATGGGDGD